VAKTDPAETIIGHRFLSTESFSFQYLFHKSDHVTVSITIITIIIIIIIIIYIYIYINDHVSGCPIFHSAVVDRQQSADANP
jgi:hypothetical protein